MLRLKCALAALLAMMIAFTAPALAEAITPAEAAVEETVVELNGSRSAEAASKAVSANDGTLGLAYTSVTMGVGEKLPLLPSDWTGDTLPTFRLSKTKIVTVGTDGLVTAKKKGTVTVTATLGDRTEVCAITVRKAPKTIKLDVDSLTLGYDAATGQGDRAVLTPVLSKDSASGITWKDYDAGVLSVVDGEIVPVGVGTTQLTACTFNNKKDTVNVTVLPAPTSAAFDPGALTVSAGERCALRVVFNEGAAAALKYESLDPACVQVDEKGMLTAVSQGTATVRATAFNGVSAECVVTVRPAPTKLFVEPASLTLGVGEESEPLDVTTDVEDAEGSYTFTPSKKKYVTVSDEGAVKALKKGSVNLKVTTANGLSRTVKVTIKAAPKSIALAPKTLTLSPGETEALKATLSKNSWSNVRYESSDPDVATVDATGRVTAVRGGEATITAATHNGHSAACAVTVVGAASEIRLEEILAMDAGTRMALPAAIIDEDGGAYAGAVAVSFAPTGIVKYSGGQLIAVKAGETVMTVAAGGIEKRCTVRVTGTSTANAIQSIAHRGGSGYWPENTLEAFRNCASKGADGIELDARSTKDGVQVIHHDATFKVGSKKYTVSKLKLSELQKLKPSVPTLDEALEVIDATGLDIHLELKDTADGAKCVKTVKSHGLEDRTVYFSFYEKQLKQVYKADSSATLGMSINASADYKSSALLKKIKDLHLSFLVANKDMMNQTVTDYWHDLGLRISVWTPNTRSEVKAMCALGVDYILSDYPDYCVDYR